MRCSSSVAALLGALAYSGCLGHGPATPGEGSIEAQASWEVPLGVLGAGAEDLDVEIRSKALACLVRRAPEPGGGTWTARALWDPSPYVRRAAIRALARRLEETEARDALASVVGRADVDPYTRGLAGTVLADAGDKRVAGVLSEAWRTASAPWQAAPLALAAARMGDPQAPAAVARALEGGEFPLEVSFFLSIGRSGLSGLAPALVEAAASVEEDLLLPVAAALVGLGAPEGEALFDQALSGSEDQQMEALDILAFLPGDVARRLVRSAARGDGHPARYARLLRVGWQETSSKEAVRAAVDPDREIRSLAIQALGRALHSSSRDDRAHGALVQALSDPEPVVRLEAIRSLGRIGHPEDRDLFLPFLASGSGRPDLFEIEAASAILCPGPP
ncbi:MAG: HEAT repeat domain-containing protein [Deltaproteobacteria bacterium]|nr:HEAT repeat domain-containing protein [Deltaproteobacteria bacterium]